MSGRHASSTADTIKDFQICMPLCAFDSCIGFDFNTDLKRQIFLAESIDCAVFKKVTCQYNSAFIVLHNYFLPLRFIRFMEIIV